MTDIVERLRDNHTVKAYVQPTFRHCGNYTEGRALLNAAADEIERLRALSQTVAGHIDLRPPSPDFRVVPVRVLQSAFDRVDAMLAGAEPDLRAANAVRIELRHLINETYALSSAQCGEG
jgi:hypothetical protein